MAYGSWRKGKNTSPDSKRLGLAVVVAARGTDAGQQRQFKLRRRAELGELPRIVRTGIKRHGKETADDDRKPDDNVSGPARADFSGCRNRQQTLQRTPFFVKSDKTTKKLRGRLEMWRIYVIIAWKKSDYVIIVGGDGNGCQFDGELPCQSWTMGVSRSPQVVAESAGAGRTATARLETAILANWFHGGGNRATC